MQFKTNINVHNQIHIDKWIDMSRMQNNLDRLICNHRFFTRQGCLLDINIWVISYPVGPIDSHRWHSSSRSLSEKSKNTSYSIHLKPHTQHPTSWKHICRVWHSIHVLFICNGWHGNFLGVMLRLTVLHMPDYKTGAWHYQWNQWWFIK